MSFVDRRKNFNEDDILLDLAGTPWEKAFTKRFLVVELQQQQQLDLMRAGKLGMAIMSTLAGFGASCLAVWYYFSHIRLP